MINWLHSRIHRPENGWDPVPEDYAAQYAENEWSHGVRPKLLDFLDQWVDGLSGRNVLDLGGGPGQYSVAFAMRGAKVTWYDVSNRYLTIAKTKAKEAGVDVRFSLGYMDEAPEILEETFDLVFNRICWNYGRGDHSFARAVYSLLKPGGVAYVDACLSETKYSSVSGSADFRARLNNATGWKIGHPYPPHGRLATLFAKKPVEKLLIDYSSPQNDRVTFIRAKTTR